MGLTDVQSRKLCFDVHARRFEGAITTASAWGADSSVHFSEQPAAPQHLLESHAWKGMSSALMKVRREVL